MSYDLGYYTGLCGLFGKVYMTIGFIGLSIDDNLFMIQKGYRTFKIQR